MCPFHFSFQASPFSLDTEDEEEEEEDWLKVCFTLRYRAMGVTCRASPSHLVFKFACATQHVLDLIPEIDKKQLSDKHRGRLRARIEESTNSQIVQMITQKKLQRRVVRSEADFRVA